MRHGGGGGGGAQHALGLGRRLGRRVLHGGGAVSGGGGAAGFQRHVGSGHEPVQQLAAGHAFAASAAWAADGDAPSRRAAGGEPLETHIETVHEKRRDHACPYCKGIAFGEKGTLTKHIKIVHEKRRDHACGYCKGIAFGTASTLETGEA